MGYASHLLAQTFQRTPFFHTAEAASLALDLYYFQLGLNILWTPLFSGWKKPGWALLDLVGLTGTTFWMTVRF